ncbi:hypothetical protein C7M84_023670 [Penaeus vannamei]|uniref:Uncharacterized protein n=1 Tax=Penaeus vannamei TaxID=6689 RepID=A0A3R7PUQ9_PENVA|nr:hypothetical protein C7M84_023670 [Penaeus vannamei]
MQGEEEVGPGGQQTGLERPPSPTARRPLLKITSFAIVEVSRARNGCKACDFWFSFPDLNADLPLHNMLLDFFEELHLTNDTPPGAPTDRTQNRTAASNTERELSITLVRGAPSKGAPDAEAAPSAVETESCSTQQQPVGSRDSAPHRSTHSMVSRAALSLSSSWSPKSRRAATRVTPADAEGPAQGPRVRRTPAPRSTCAVEFTHGPSQRAPCSATHLTSALATLQLFRRCSLRSAQPLATYDTPRSGLRRHHARPRCTRPSTLPWRSHGDDEDPGGGREKEILTEEWRRGGLRSDAETVHFFKPPLPFLRKIDQRRSMHVRGPFRLAFSLFSPSLFSLLSCPPTSTTSFPPAFLLSLFSSFTSISSLSSSPCLLSSISSLLLPFLPFSTTPFLLSSPLPPPPRVLRL